MMGENNQGRAALWAALFATTVLSMVLLVIQPGGAQGTPGAGSSVAPGDVSCASTQTRFINGAGPSTELLPLVLPAGEYRVTIRTHDAYEGRSAADPAGQTSERVRVFGITTADLQDGIEAADATIEGVVVLAAPVDGVLVEHVPAGVGPDSVTGVRVCVQPVPVVVVHDIVPEPAPTPEPEPTPVVTPDPQPVPSPTRSPVIPRVNG